MSLLNHQYLKVSSIERNAFIHCWICDKYSIFFFYFINISYLCVHFTSWLCFFCNKSSAVNIWILNIHDKFYFLKRLDVLLLLFVILLKSAYLVFIDLCKYRLNGITKALTWLLIWKRIFYQILYFIFNLTFRIVFVIPVSNFRISKVRIL